jgi:hypothetical protein
VLQGADIIAATRGLSALWFFGFLQDIVLSFGLSFSVEVSCAMAGGIVLMKQCNLSSSSLSGPGACAPDAPQPVGLLCYPCTALVF